MSGNKQSLLKQQLIKGEDSHKNMFKAKDLKTGEMVKIDRIEFTGGEITSVMIIKNGSIEERPDGEDLEIYVNGLKI